MNQTIPMFRNRFLNEKLEEVKRWKEEGKSKEEVLGLIDRKILTDEDVDEIYNNGNLNNNQNISETNSVQNIQNETTDNFKEEHKEESNNQEEVEEKNTIEEDTENENHENIFGIEEKEFDEIVDKTLDEYRTNEQKENRIEEEYKDIPDEDLIDFEDQPFKLYNEEKQEEMIRSIKLNGIIQPLIVRQLENGKYQILSGHNRRICGRKAGLKVFPCKIKYNLTDDEAKLYLVDTNLATREEISPMEKARALKIRKETYRNEKIKAKIESGIKEDNTEDIDVRKKIQEIENMSSGNLQRYLRLNYLDKTLQDLVDNGKVALKVAENLSYLPKDKQKIVGNLIEKDNVKVSESQAVKLKKEEDLNKDKIVEMLSKKPQEENTTITIKFEKEELQNFFSEEAFNDLNTIKNTIKNTIINALEIQKRQL